MQLHQNFRVPHRLRLVNQAAYEPELILIGPNHVGKEHLQDMEMTKRQCLKRIDRRKGHEIMCRCFEEIRNMEATIRQWYRVPEAFISKDDLAGLMVIDGCFIIELLCREPQDLMSKLQWSRAALFGDLLLLENQLPFFVLVKLYGLIKDSTDGTDFAPQALDKLIRMLPGPNIATAYLSTIKDTDEIHHLLGLIHDNWVPSPPGIQRYREYVEEIKKAEAEAKEKKRQPGTWKFILCAIAISKQKKLGQGNQESGTANKGHWKFICFSREKAKRLGGRVGRQSIRCARELEEAGIEFIKVDCGSDEDDSNQESYAKSLFDVEFTGGKMKIPTLVIGDNTERLFRNLIAYELYVQGSTYVIDYVTLMDNLVNTANDVQLLRLCGVIVNMLGDDDAVAQMLNKLRDCVTLCGETFYYEKMFVDVKQHCARSWNTWKAKLRQQHFVADLSIGQLDLKAKRGCVHYGDNVA
ncbi:putative UPF0481 protein At3g02645 [Durio zibethinus]|uniref:UPF0481 protein At3g02645 n=1 Tax=Durio zibethinus TaxID=66656 RepID=A0A6P5WPA0_DURZI|nr:putative UPF0481 protein At3g02645 [Durio zibethinus]